MIVVSVNEQTLYHHRQTGVCISYPVSTAANGVGNQQGGFQTPLGRHKVVEKIGDGMDMFTIFRARKPIGVYDSLSLDTSGSGGDLILSRILRLAGCETGKNRRGQVDSFQRYIYIHGTHDEAAIGTPASHGCIRMKNADVVHLFAHVHIGEAVYIRR